MATATSSRGLLALVSHPSLAHPHSRSDPHPPSPDLLLLARNAVVVILAGLFAYGMVESGTVLACQKHGKFDE